MSGMLLETCWAFNERWNNNFCYKVASCWLFLPSQLDQFRHTSERKASMVYNTDNENEKMLKFFFSVGHLFQCCQNKLKLIFLQISVSGTGVAPLATGNTASYPEGNNYSATCIFAPRPQNKARRTVSCRPTFQSPPAQCASSNR